MNVLIVCENEAIKSKLVSAVKEKGEKHNYKVVASGEGKMNAAVTTALEINADVAKYDCVASIGVATGGPFVEPGSIVIGNKTALWDVHGPVNPEDGKEIEIEGIDDITVLSGDDTLSSDAYMDVVTLFGKAVCFDTITFGVASIAKDYGMDVLAIKFIGGVKDDVGCVPAISYIESIA